ncbi:MAG TPA: TadE/TadG family type IV pilus assembly protein [Planctomycetaceae bacterium]|nr:TadE/TadG family type IV pilus assembly protein [Planctomycetaceae bacterium]
MRRKLQIRRHSRRGAAMVEFALVSPLFLCLIVGIVEVGRAVVVQQLLTNASREGVRIASYDSTTQTATVTSAVNAYLSNVGIKGATTTISPSGLSSLADGQSVSVSVSVPFTSVSLLPTPILLGDKTLQATSVMCREPAP